MCVCVVVVAVVVVVACGEDGQCVEVLRRCIIHHSAINGGIMVHRRRCKGRC